MTAMMLVIINLIMFMKIYTVWRFLWIVLARSALENMHSIREVFRKKMCALLECCNFMVVCRAAKKAGVPHHEHIYRKKLSVIFAHT